ncbi:DUF5677 domain-containing protein [Rheinheimera sp.]|uniref:DUF5677 domain-containing protein n=1 Tax=Rheinheimera sp. TaxID=1869214 RepID=UPI0027334CDF|nr:DUF5677 domain-containing protein [Rheinheimera sp.]MDP2714532.1 DUF5677 domain-containing protein [Rheinheimera sp.]
MLETQQLDFEISELFASVDIQLAESMKTSKCQHTLIHLYGLVASCEAIKNGIADAYESHNVYVSKSLLRVLVEHFLRFNYLFLSYIQNSSDATAREFSEFCTLKEEMDSIKANNFKNKMLGVAEVNLNSALRAKFPHAGDLSNRRISKISEKWAYKNIVDLVSTFDIDQAANMSSFLAGLVPLYSELSSFVHGGINAANYVRCLTANDQEQIIISDDYRSACRIAGFTKVFSTMIAAQSNASLLPIVLQLNKLMEQLKSGARAGE